MSGGPRRVTAQLGAAKDMLKQRSRYTLVMIPRARPTIYTVFYDGRPQGTLRPGERMPTPY